ncbi:reticulon B2 [Olea europaea subsp. europaea]|uniref:Reticulon-like protein n=1 Tax=Olea europaea subsp. europaea TaxID=158383 RepID=A0A8S0UEA2_OLEEU|nr:reticulon B2 [Olea europaea subsp. europaea]
MAIGTIFVESGGGGLGRGAGVNDDAVKLYWWLSLSRLPAVVLGGDVFLGVASALRIELNRAFAILRDISSGKDLKKFLMAIAGLWVLSILGNCCNFLTLLFVLFCCTQCLCSMKHTRTRLMLLLRKPRLRSRSSMLCSMSRY